MMARRARMLALLQLSSLVLLLVVELTHTAPISDDSFVNGVDVNSVSNEDEAPMLSITVDNANRLEDVEESLDEDSIYASVKSEYAPDVTEESKEMPEERMDKSIKSGDAPDGGLAISEENDRTTESSDAGKDEDYTSIENEDDTDVRGNNDAVAEESAEKNEDPMTTKAGENVNDAKSEESVDKADDSIIGTAGVEEEDSEENMGTDEVKATESDPSKEQIITAMAESVRNDHSEDFVDTSTDENDADKEYEDVEEEAPEETALKTDDASEDKVSEETSDAENEAGDMVTNENQRSIHQDIHGSPFARLGMPSSESHHIGKNEQHESTMEKYENNSSIEETNGNEASSPNELIEDDKVDSEVIMSDNKTAALGKAMPIIGAEEDAQNNNESLQDTGKDSETSVLYKLEIIGQQVEATVNETPNNTKETEATVLGGKLIDDVEEEDEKYNFLPKDHTLSKADLDYSSEENEDGFFADVRALNVLHVTENPSGEEGSGIAPDMVGFVSHEDVPKDTSDTSNHEAENRKEGSQANEDEVVSEKEEIKSSIGTDYRTHDFRDSGSGNEEEFENFGKQGNNGTNDADDDVGSGSYSLPVDYEDEIASEQPTTKRNVHSVVPHVLVVGDIETSCIENPCESLAPETETSTISESADDQNESDDRLSHNNTDVQVMSLNPTPVPDESDSYDVTFDGSGDDDTTTPVAISILADIIDDDMAVPCMKMDFVNSSIGEASPAYQEKPVEKVISSQSGAAPTSPNTEPSCIEDEENEDCLPHSNKPYEDDGETNILEDDDEVPLEPTTDNDLKEQPAISTAPAVKVSIEEESPQESIAVDLNKPFLHSNEEARSTTLAPEIQEITEPIEDYEAMDNETMNLGAPDIIVKYPLDDVGIKEMSGKIRAANVNELGVSGQENSDDLGEPEELDSSSASGSYVVLGCIMTVVVVLLAYAAIKSRRERGTNTCSRKEREEAGDDDGTELKDMKKSLLSPETPRDDCNGDIESNTKPLMDKDENQEEDEEKESIIKQNGTLELSETPRDIESQVVSSTAENQQKPAPTANEPQQRNGLSEVVVETPTINNGKTDSIITHPVAAKVKVIENEDSIAKTPVIITRGSNSPTH